jgi:outer membrane protein W
MKRTIVALLCAILLIGAVVAASGQDGLLGRKEAAFSVAWADIGDTKTTMANVRYGTFFTPQVEALVGVTYNKASDGTSETAWGASLGAAWHFVPATASSTVPYIGAGFNYLKVSDGVSDSDTSYGIFGGAKFFLGGDYTTSKSAVFVQFDWVNDVFGDNMKTLSVGISTWF